MDNESFIKNHRKGIPMINISLSQPRERGGLYLHNDGSLLTLYARTRDYASNRGICLCTQGNPSLIGIAAAIPPGSIRVVASVTSTDPGTAMSVGKCKKGDLITVGSVAYLLFDLIDTKVVAYDIDKDEFTLLFIGLSVTRHTTASLKLESL